MRLKIRSNLAEKKLQTMSAQLVNNARKKFGSSKEKTNCVSAKNKNNKINKMNYNLTSYGRNTYFR